VVGAIDNKSEITHIHKSVATVHAKKKKKLEKMATINTLCTNQQKISTTPKITCLFGLIFLRDVAKGMFSQCLLALNTHKLTQMRPLFGANYNTQTQNPQIMLQFFGVEGKVPKKKAPMVRIVGGGVQPGQSCNAPT
jgi:hypothetical protein